MQVYIILYAVVQKVDRVTGCWQIDRSRRAIILVSLKSCEEKKIFFTTRTQVRFDLVTYLMCVLQLGLGSKKGIESEPIRLNNNIILLLCTHASRLRVNRIPIGLKTIVYHSRITDWYRYWYNTSYIEFYKSWSMWVLVRISMTKL